MAARKQKKPPLYYLLLSLTSVLLVCGLVMIASASSFVAYQEHKDSFYFLWRQVMNAGIGLVALAIASRMDYRSLRKISLIGLIASTALLVAVLIVGRTAGGASRWLELGGFPLQPSEFAKLAVILYTADLLSRRQRRNLSLGELAKPLGIPVLLIGGLVLLQPDLGTALIILGAVFAMLFLANVKFGELFLLSATGISAVLALIMVEPYRRSRLLAFLDPWAQPKGNGFQLIQALMAFGSGGVTGVGLGLSRQKFGYLPAPYTDFILAIIGEELGLVGTLAVVLLFILLAVTVMKVVRECDEPFGKLLGGGIGAMIISQAVINMGGVTGLLPITGVPLPLISFGGSSLILTLGSIGILLNLTIRKKKRNKPGVDHESHDLRRRNGGARLSRARAGRSA